MSLKTSEDMVRLQAAAPPAKVDSYRLDGGIASNHFTGKVFYSRAPQETPQ
jgi:hypothetical protein